MGEDHDAIVRSRLAFPDFQHFGFDVNRVAVKKWFRESHFVHAQIGNGGTNRRVADRYADHECQG